MFDIHFIAPVYIAWGLPILADIRVKRPAITAIGDSPKAANFTRKMQLWPKVRGRISGDSRVRRGRLRWNWG